MKAIISLAILLMATLTAWADSAKARWTIYPSYSNITEIEPVGNICFVLASGAVFSYNITDGDVQTYDKAGVMSDVEVSHIGWSKAGKCLVVVYTNSNIDLLSANGDVINVPDLYRKSTTYSKTVNHIDFDGPYAYLATAFGVVKLNTRDGAIMDTYQLDTDVSYTYVKTGTSTPSRRSADACAANSPTICSTRAAGCARTDLRRCARIAQTYKTNRQTSGGQRLPTAN